MALTLTVEAYRDRLYGGWRGKSAGITLGAGARGQLTPGHDNFYTPVPGQPAASLALDFPLVWLAVLEECGADIVPEDLAVGWLEHLDYSQDEFGYAALNLRRGLPPPASGAHSNWFRHATGGVMRADIWAMIAPGAPQVAAAYAYHDAKLDHCDEGVWAAMLLAAMGSAAFFLTDPIILLTIGLAMIPRTCRTARAVKTAIAAMQRSAGWMEARSDVLREVGHANFTDAPQNIGFLTIGLLYGNAFGASLCAGVNCGYDTEAVGAALGAILGIRDGSANLPEDWMRPLGDILIPGQGMRDLDMPLTLAEVADRAVAIGRQIVAARCPEVEIVDALPEPLEVPPSAATAEVPADVVESGFLPQAVAAPDLPRQIESASPPVPPAPDPSDPFDIEPDTVESVSAVMAAPPVLDAGAEPPVLPETAPPPPPDTPAPDAPPPPEIPPATEPAPPMGVLRPQAVSADASAPVASPVSPEADGAVRVAPVVPDLLSAIAWADNTQVKPLLVTPPNALVWQVGPFDVVMDTGDSPTIAYNQPKKLTFSVVNRGPAFSGRITLMAPPGWQIGEPTGIGQRQYLAAETGTFRAEYTLRAPEGQARIDIANAVTLRFTPEGGGVPNEAEFLLLGAACWWTVGVFANFDGEGFDRSYLPEDRPGLNELYSGRNMQSVRWEKHAFPESTLDLEPLFKGSSGVCYGQTVLHSPTARDARLVANTNSGVKIWFNGTLAFRRFQKSIFRPSLQNSAWSVDVSLRAGDNPLLIKWVRGNEPFAFSLSVTDRYGRALPEVGNTTW